MAEIKFDARVSSIVNFEKETGSSIMDAFGEKMSMSKVIILVKCCSNADDKTIDEYVKENGFNKLVEGLLNALTESGFLPKTEASPMAE